MKSKETLYELVLTFNEEAFDEDEIFEGDNSYEELFIAYRFQANNLIKNFFESIKANNSNCNWNGEIFAILKYEDGSNRDLFRSVMDLYYNSDGDYVETWTESDKYKLGKLWQSFDSRYMSPLIHAHFVVLTDKPEIIDFVVKQLKQLGQLKCSEVSDFDSMLRQNSTLIENRNLGIHMFTFRGEKVRYSKKTLKYSS